MTIPNEREIAEELARRVKATDEMRLRNELDGMMTIPAPESSTPRCESMSGANLVHDPMRCDLPLGHDGNHTAAVNTGSQLSWLANAPAPASCYEVVERLYEECAYTNQFDRKKAAAILHEWRERRVQELEKCLRWSTESLRGCLPLVQGNGYRDSSDKIKEGIKACDDTLAKSDEWREQIRKGANQ